MCSYKITACFLLFILQNQIKLIKINPLKTSVKPHFPLYFSIITLIGVVALIQSPSIGQSLRWNS